MLTDAELRQAAFALDVIDERGDPDVLELILQRVNKDTPTGYDWGDRTLRQELNDGYAADRLSKLLNVPVERCTEAVMYWNGTGRQQLRFKAIVDYAIELIGPCIELTGQGSFVPYADRHPEPTPTPSTRRPSTIRIVREGVA